MNQIPKVCSEMQISSDEMLPNFGVKQAECRN